MGRTDVVKRVGACTALWLLASTAALGQAPVFRAAPTFPVSGASTDATSQIVVGDVGSRNGPPDGLLDVVTAAQNQQSSVLFGRGDGTFRSGPNTNLGRIPTAIALGTFDDDEFLDLVVADTGNTLSFFRGFSGGPPFERVGDPIDVGREPVALVPVDLNGDDDLDLVIVNEGGQSAGELRLLLGNGDGTFAPPSPPADPTVSTGVASAGCAVSDFDGDGDFDFAVVNGGSNDVTVIRSDAGGKLTVLQTVTVGDEPVAISAGDLDGDEVPDLVVSNRVSDTLSALRGQGNGRFNEAQSFPSGSAGSAPTGLALADVNLDGRTDAVVPNNFSSDVSVLLGNGSGGFLPPRVFVADEQPLGVATGLFNEDEFVDVVAVNRGSSAPNVASMLSVGDGSLEAVEDLVAATSPVDLAVGDLDNDGRADISLVHSSGQLFAYRALPGASFAPPRRLNLEEDQAVVGHADLNRDGLLDIVTASKSNRQASVLLGRATGDFAAPTLSPLNLDAAALVVADWNTDGRPDVAVTGPREQGSGGVDVLLAAPDGTLGAAVALAVGSTPVDIDTGDFNDDGRPDAAVADNAANTVAVLLGNGDGTFTAGTPVNAAGGPKSVAVSDFDRDGCEDIAVALATNRAVNVLYGDCSANFAVDGFPLQLGGTPSAVQARDLNGDGLPDLLVGDEVSNTAVVFIKSAGNRFFQSLSGNEFPVSRRPIETAIGDFDGDGAYDGAAVNSFVAGSVSVLTNILAPAVLRGDGNGDERVTAADTLAALREVVDGDGVRVEDVGRGTYAAAAGVDANGDGSITAQDARGVAHRLFAMF